MDERVLAGAREVGQPMTFSTLIIGLAFLPLFTLVGVPGAPTPTPPVKVDAGAASNSAAVSPATNGPPNGATPAHG